MNIQLINAEIKRLKDASLISDGYHTFSELYDHRVTLFIALCNTIIGFYESEGVGLGVNCWKSRFHHDGTFYEDWFIAGINTEPGEQISYHLPAHRWDELRATELERAPEWDGHKPKDVIERIKKYLYL